MSDPTTHHHGANASAGDGHKPCCQEICEFLSEYLDDELCAERRVIFQAHLDQCPPCAEFLARLRGVSKISKASCCDGRTRIPLPDDMVKAIMSAIAATKPGAPAPDACQPKRGCPEI
jgi:anti-sigma factor RsiW